MGKKDGKPRGRMSAYAFFVQTCREEHKKKHPGESVVFAEFSKKCAEKWKVCKKKKKEYLKKKKKNGRYMYSPLNLMIMVHYDQTIHRWE